MSMKIRGSTQLVDASIPLEKLSLELQERFLREQKRADFVTTAGQTALSHTDFSSGMPTYVYHNGVMLQPSEFSVSAGSITLSVAAQLGDQITVLYGKTSMLGVFSTLDAPLTYTYTGTLDSAPFAVQTAPVVPAADGKEYVGQIFMQGIGDVTGIEFPNLGGVTVSFTPNNMAALTSLSLPALTIVGGTFAPAKMAALTSLNLPALAIVSGSFSPNYMAALNSLSLPALTVTGQFAPSYMNSLTSMNFPLLAVVSNNFSPNNIGALSILSLPALTAVDGVFALSSMAALTTISLPAIKRLGTSVTSGNAIQLNSGTAALINFAFPPALKQVGGLTGSVIITSAALNQTSVDSILIRLAALDGTNGTTAFSSRTVTITGTSATPSATGLAAKAVLQARGCTVTHN